MKRWLASLFFLFFALFIAVASTSRTAYAQATPSADPVVPGATSLSLQPSLTPIQPPTTPAPTATPAAVGRNIGPVEPALPQGYPGSVSAAPGSISEPNQNKQPVQIPVNREQQNTAGSSTASLHGQPPKMIEQPNMKSEIISALPPVAKVAELRAVLRTSVGDITIRLDRAKAARTANYFLALARGEIDFTDIKTSKQVKRPFYNGLIFHRVVKNTLIQTGDPFGNGRGGSGTTNPDENTPSMKFDRPGLVAMAPMREGVGTTLAKNSSSSQFFITLREMPEWNGQFTIFGEVEDGMDVVQKIANVKVGPTERPIKRIYLVAVEIIESTK